MKKLFFLLPMCLCLTSYGQDVPSSVTSSFKKKFPNVDDVEWSLYGNNHQASFLTSSGEDQAALFNAKGTWLETCTFFEEEDFPNSVSSALEKKYPGSFFSQIMKCKDQKGGEFFRLGVEVDEDSYLIKIDTNGKILESIVQKKEEEEED